MVHNTTQHGNGHAVPRAEQQAAPWCSMSVCIARPRAAPAQLRRGNGWSRGGDMDRGDTLLQAAATHASTRDGAAAKDEAETAAN
jgi:hypothetical protein